MEQQQSSKNNNNEVVTGDGNHDGRILRNAYKYRIHRALLFFSPMRQFHTIIIFQSTPK